MKTETEIINEVVNLSNNLTVIGVSHRIESLDLCNKIYHLENGLFL